MAEPPSRATVVLTMPPTADLAQFEECEMLKQNLRSMVNNPEYSDVQFVCSDGGRVYACRLLLVARSPVLKSLLTNGMSESRLREIPLPDITTAAMLTTVEFLYTGTIVQNKPTLVCAFQTLHASRFLMLDRLEKCVMHTVVATVKAEVMDAEFLVWCFTQFAEQIHTKEKPIMHEVDSGAAGLIQDMAANLEGRDTQTLNNLSVQAFDVYLDATSSRNVSTISFKEYLRLRRILLWACSKVSLQAEEELRIRLPDEECLRGAFLSFRESSAEREFGKKAPESPLEPCVVQEMHKWVETLVPGWSSVQLQCIHPLMLAEILEPLDIVPQSLFLSALRCQAIRTGEMNVLKWEPGDGCKIQENGAVLECVVPYVNGWANMAMNHGLCEWEITVEAPSTWLLIGLGKFDGTQVAQLCSQSGMLYPAGSHCKTFGHKGSKVRVHLDMKLRTCAFTIDGERFDAPWFDLPYEVYPSVWLEKPGRVRIKLKSDADFI